MRRRGEQLAATFVLQQDVTGRPRRGLIIMLTRTCKSRSEDMHTRNNKIKSCMSFGGFEARADCAEVAARYMIYSITLPLPLRTRYNLSPHPEPDRNRTHSRLRGSCRVDTAVGSGVNSDANNIACLANARGSISRRGTLTNRC